MKELKEALDPIHQDVQKLSDRLDILEQAGTRSPSMASAAAPSLTAEIEHNIYELEKQFTNLKGDGNRECNAVIGGLGDCSDLDAAVAFSQH